MGIDDSRCVAGIVAIAPISLSAIAAGCAEVAVVSEATPKPPVALPVAVRVQPCVDRTETAGRDLGVQATRAFEEKLRAMKEFVVRADARSHLACDVTSFVEGSSIKRWLLPGWGPTVGQVAGRLTDSTTGEVVLVARGNATVAGGGLYTIGADTYIVPLAADEVVVQLCTWACGESTGSASPTGESLRGRAGRQVKVAAIEKLVDVNGDGRLDLVLVTATGWVVLPGSR